MIVNFVALRHTAVLPSYGKPGDAGLDLTATHIINNTSSQITYGTDLAVEIPPNYVGLIYPRSSIRSTELILSNCVGVIDSGYRGEIQATFNKLAGLDSWKYAVGTRIMQMIVMPYPQIEPTFTSTLSESARGRGGFGSTGQ